MNPRQDPWGLGMGPAPPAKVYGSGYPSREQTSLELTGAESTRFLGGIPLWSPGAQCYKGALMELSGI